MDTKPPKSNSASQRAARRFPTTDAGNAEFFAGKYKDKLRYIHGGGWFLWRDHWWAEDKVSEVLQKAKLAARHRYDLASSINDEKAREGQQSWARHSESKAGICATLALAKSEPLLSTRSEECDTGPWLFGVGNGVVDLRTGRLRNGKQSDLITLHSPVIFDATAQCPRWEQFLSEIFGGDNEQVAFVQRGAGYCLTGDTREQCFFGCFGSGSNGKSTFLELVRYVLGDYAYNLPISAFEVRSRSSIPNDIAPLRGKRFVTALETDESAALNVARIKLLTGCDPVSARFLHKEFFTFVPVAKFWLAFNHKPIVADDSPGFWRRVRLIPFEQSFLKRHDQGLLDKLKAESPGILNWLVRGCLAWQKEGLGLPAKIEEATQSYRDESDVLGLFLADYCSIHPAAKESVANLWQTFREWSAENGDRFLPLTRSQFTDRLEARGFKKVRAGHDRTWTWQGLCVRNPGLPRPSPTNAEADICGHEDPIVGLNEDKPITKQ
jgi:putative DNA primase/helicase